MQRALVGRKMLSKELILTNANLYRRNTKGRLIEVFTGRAVREGCWSGWLLNGSKGSWPGAKQSVVGPL